MANVRVSLYQSIKVDGKWTFRKVALQRLRTLSEGGYYVRSGTRMDPAGRDPAIAIAALRRKQAELAFLGQSLQGRDGLTALMRLASSKPCPFQGVVIDDTSRFGRNLSDTLPVSDRLAFCDIFLYFANRSFDSRDPNFRTLFITNGHNDELFNRGLAEKVHRGQRGRVLNGFLPCGRVFGYRNVPIENPLAKVAGDVLMSIL